MKQQLSLFDLEQFTAPPVIKSAYDDIWDETETVKLTVLEQVTPNTQQASKLDSTVLEQDNKFAPEQCHWVEKYKVIRYHKEHYYYRYIWMSNRKLHHVHIPGGNVRSQLAIERKAAVENACDRN